MTTEDQTGIDDIKKRLDTEKPAQMAREVIEEYGRMLANMVDVLQMHSASRVAETALAVDAIRVGMAHLSEPDYEEPAYLASLPRLSDHIAHLGTFHGASVYFTTEGTFAKPWVICQLAFPNEAGPILATGGGSTPDAALEAAAQAYRDQQKAPGFEPTIPQP